MPIWNLVRAAYGGSDSKSKDTNKQKKKYLARVVTHIWAVEQHSAYKPFFTFLTPVIATALIHIFL